LVLSVRMHTLAERMKVVTERQRKIDVKMSFIKMTQGDRRLETKEFLSKKHIVSLLARLSTPNEFSEPQDTRIAYRRQKPTMFICYIRPSHMFPSVDSSTVLF
jgi:hypothetical protein